MDHIRADELVNRAIGLREGERTSYVDVIKLADTLDVDVFFSTDESDSFNACIERDSESNRYNILVNPTQPQERQRFSIAHELAHYILHREKLDREGKLNRDPDDIINKKEEDEADHLAAEVLMPTELLEEYTKELGLEKKEPVSKNIIERIASYFKVSRTVAAIKLRELEYFVPFTSFA